jgi:hypothetical protein
MTLRWKGRKMSDDLEKRLQANGDVLRHIETQAAEIDRLRARAQRLEKALQKIQSLARTGRPHPMSRKTDYFQIAATALTGVKDE